MLLMIGLVGGLVLTFLRINKLGTKNYSLFYQENSKQ